MDKFFEPRISKETMLFAVVFSIFIVGVLFGVRIAHNQTWASSSGVAGAGFEFTQ